VQALAAAGADERHDVFSAREHPRDCDLRNRGVVCLGDATEAVDELGITAYGVLSRGLLSGHWSRERKLTPRDFRSISARFQGDNLEHNLELARGRTDGVPDTA
jgi:hypothetical protein